MLFVLMELFGYKEVNNFFKDHGSLIAGLIGFGGIFLLMSNQNKSTNKIIKSTLTAIQLESSEIQKYNYISEAITVSSALGHIKLDHEELPYNLIAYKIDASTIKALHKGFNYLSMQNISQLKETQKYITEFWAFFHDIYKSNLIIYNQNQLEEIKSRQDNQRKLVINQLSKALKEVEEARGHEPKDFNIEFHRQYTLSTQEAFREEIWVTEILSSTHTIDRISPDFVKKISAYGLQSCKLYLDSLIKDVRDMNASNNLSK